MLMMVILWVIFIFMIFCIFLISHFEHVLLYIKTLIIKYFKLLKFPTFQLSSA